MSFQAVELFEKKIAEFFGAPFGVAVDSCTHAIELCLRYNEVNYFCCPNRTYVSIPMLADKLKIKFSFNYKDWYDYYWLNENIIDAAVLWKRNYYIRESFMCVSFQYQKHLSLGRGGIILCDDENAATELKKMSYDGRVPNVPWRDQNISSMGYHYYMTPETAELGLSKLNDAINKEPRIWTHNDYPDLTTMNIFKR